MRHGSELRTGKRMKSSMIRQAKTSPLRGFLITPCEPVECGVEEAVVWPRKQIIYLCVKRFAP